MTVDVQYAVTGPGLPAASRLAAFVQAALLDDAAEMDVCVRLVGGDEGEALNARYRGRQYATNVLSFPGEPNMGILGDLVVCVPVVHREAAEQGKSADAHWAHMLVHGTLHLQGYDHQEDGEAEQMETMERDILMQFGVEDPYRSEHREQSD